MVEQHEHSVITSLYDYSRVQVSNSITQGRYISIFTCLQPPLEVRLCIHSFGDQRYTINDNKTEEWVRAGGVDAFPDFRLLGYVSHHNPFKQHVIEVRVNHLSSLPRYSLSSEGILGKGTHERARFSVWLYFALDVSKELLAHVRERGRRHPPPKPLEELLRLWNLNKMGWEGEEHQLDLGMKFQDEITGFNPAFANLRLDLCDIVRGDHLNQGKTIFNVCRIYA